MLYEMTGTVKAVLETQTFASGFTKRQCVVMTEEDRFPKPIAFSFLKDRCALLEGLKEGERVKVKFGLGGREWQGKYFTDLEGVSIDRLDIGAVPADEPGFVSGTAPSDFDDEMPF